MKILSSRGPGVFKPFLCDYKVQEGFPQGLLPQSQGLDFLLNWLNANAAHKLT